MGLVVAVALARRMFSTRDASETRTPELSVGKAAPEPSPEPTRAPDKETQEWWDLLDEVETSVQRPPRDLPTPEELAKAKRELAELERSLPMYSDELVHATVRATFPKQVDEATEVLLVYGSGRTDAEVHRIRIAILKNSLGKLDLLRGQVEAADTDYRDVLMWAEFSEQSRLRLGSEGLAAAAAYVWDRTEYLKWVLGL